MKLVTHGLGAPKGPSLPFLSVLAFCSPEPGPGEDSQPALNTDEDVPGLGFPEELRPAVFLQSHTDFPM